MTDRERAVLPEWLRDRVAVGDGCWEWQGRRTEDGYAVTSMAGDPGRNHRVSRLVVASALGRPLLATERALHRCDNPPCVRPTHLYAGTPAENSRDMVQRRRSMTGDLNAMKRPEIRAQHQGSANGGAKLTEEAVVAIRELLTAGLSKSEIGRRFGVHRTLIGMIERGQKWTHVK